MELSKNTQHWIAPNALTIGLNFDGMPDYIQVSVLANAVILSYIEGVIGYDQSHNYRKWYISAFNTKLSSAAAHYVYARLDKGGTTALIVYDTLARNIYGATDSNPDYQDENYYYVYLGKISPNYDESTLASKARIWEDGIHYGMLSTPESPYQSIQVENDIRLSPTSAIIIGDACLKYDAKNKALYTEYKNGDPLSFYTTGGSSAKGISPKGESGGGGASALYQLNDVLKNATEDGVQGAEKDKVLMFNGTHWYAGDAKGKVVAVKVGQEEYKPSEEGIVTLPEFAKVVDKTLTVDKFIGALEGNADTATKLKNALTIQKNKTEIGVFDGSEAKTVNITVPTKVSELTNDSNYLTAHQTLYALTIQGNGTSLGVYTPNSEAKIINITAAGIGAAATTHKQAYTADACTTYTTDNENMGVTPAAVKKAIGLFEPKAHTHTISQVTDLSATLAKYYDSTISRIANTVLAAPNGSNGSATFRKLVAADIPSLDWSKITSGKPTTLAGYGITDGVNSVTVSGSGNAVTSASVSGHGLTLTKGETFLAKSVFDDLFEKVLLSDGVTYAIRAKYGFYSDSFVSAKGANSSTGGSTGGAASIYVGSTLYTPDGEGIIHLPAYPTIPDSLKNPYALTIQANGTSLGTYDGSAANTLNITYANVGAAPSSHASDTTLHITSSERTNWNNSLRGRGNIIGNGTPTSSDFTSVGTLCGCWNAGSNTNYGNLIQFYSGGGGSTNYVQFWSIYSGDMMWRNSIESALSSRAWRTLIDSVNFSSYAATKVHTHAISDVTGLQTKLDDKYSYSVSRIANTVLAAPNGASGSATFRKLVLADLPSSVNSYTDLGLTDNNYSDYTWFVIGLFSISDTYQGGTGTSQGVVYISRDKGSHWNFNIEYAISNYYSQPALSQADQKVRMMVRQMTVESSMRPCTFIHNGVKYAGLAWTSNSSPHKAKVMASYAQCAPFLIRYYRTSSAENGEAILNSEIYNSIRIDDTDIVYQSEYLFGNLKLFHGSLQGNADTATKLKNYYTSRPSDANLSPDGSGGMCKFLATSTMTSNKPAVDGHILHLYWDTTGGWDSQLMIPNNGNSSYEPQWRGQNNGTWGSWISLVTSGTIGNYNAGSATKLQTARTLWGQSFDGTANVGGTITGTNFKINDTSSNPYLMLGTSWYVQLYQSMIQIGYSAYNSIKVDSSGNLILPTSSRRIYFNGSTSDNQCIVYDNSSGRLSVGSSAAKGFNVGSLLVSSAWSDSTLVPTNGIYSKGDIYSAGAITAKASSSDIRLKCDLTEYDALSIVRGQRSVMYHWNETAKRNSTIFDDDDWHYGLIAQELQREHPQLVKDVFGDYLTIDYERLIPILWRAVQQLAKRNEELEVKLNEERR